MAWSLSEGDLQTNLPASLIRVKLIYHLLPLRTSQGGAVRSCKENGVEEAESYFYPNLQSITLLLFQ